MDVTTYSLGILCGLAAGVIFGTGTVLQKIAINKVSDVEKLMNNLIRDRLWVIGFLFQFILGSFFLFLSQLLVGPVLTPGFTAVGLIIIAIGSVKIIGESLKNSEMIGILLMIIAIFMLSFSELSIEITETYFLDGAFLFRAYLFSAILFLGAGSCAFIQKRSDRFRGILLAVVSGLLFSIENIWLGFILIIFIKIFQGIFILLELIILVIACVFLIIVNFYGVISLQKAYHSGQASNLAPIQSVPIQLAPIFVYFFVFLLTPPSMLSIFLLITSIILILMSSFLLGKRQAQLEKIQ